MAAVSTASAAGGGLVHISALVSHRFAGGRRQPGLAEDAISHATSVLGRISELQNCIIYYSCTGAASCSDALVPKKEIGGSVADVASHVGAQLGVRAGVETGIVGVGDSALSKLIFPDRSRSRSLWCR